MSTAEVFGVLDEPDDLHCQFGVDVATPDPLADRITTKIELAGERFVDDYDIVRFDRARAVK